MIKFVFFDVGGVALLDFSGTNKWEEMMIDMGIKEKDFNKFDNFYDSLDGKQNIDLDMDDLMPKIEKEFGVKLRKNYSLLSDGFVKRFEKNTFIGVVIDEISRDCGVGLLTNMYPRMFDEILKEKLLPNHKWDYVVDSSVAKLQKPDRKIYELAETMCGFTGPEILFVDNTQKHLDAANKLGWLTFLYDPKCPKESSRDLLKYFREKVA